MNTGVTAGKFRLEDDLQRETDMEDLHRIHKDVPFGYWVEWVVPAYRWVARRLKTRTTSQAAALGLRRPTAR